MGFKEDADFARYLTIGAYAAWAVADDLTRWGHRIIELERYAMANKVWRVKVKRLRLPDLLCVNCGRRFESKGKSKFEIKLSHSTAEGREWHAGGMRPTDIFAFIRVEMAANGPVAFRPLYVTPEALRDALDAVKEGPRKAVSEGSESDIKWPAWVPSYSGKLIGCSAKGDIEVVNGEGRTRRYRNHRKWPAAYLYLASGEAFDASSTAVAGAVAPADVRCGGVTWDPSHDLASADHDTRYAAVKASRFRPPESGLARLEAIASNEDEDWRIRLEALAACASVEPAQYTPELVRQATDTVSDPERQMEAVFVQTELCSSLASEGLTQVAAQSRTLASEVRAAAAWGLGTDPSAAVHLLGLLDDDDDRVALHAASALPAELPHGVLQQLLEWCREGTSRQSAMAATLLARHGCVQELHCVATDPRSSGRMYAIRALGDLPPQEVEEALGAHLEPELRHVLEPIWVAQNDWLRSDENEGALDVLAAQRLAR